MATKRTFQELRDRMLKSLLGHKKTVNQLSHDTGINWKTVDNHLVFLLGKRMVVEVFSSPYVKIFELTPRGRDYLYHLEGTHHLKRMTG